MMSYAFAPLPEGGADQAAGEIAESTCAESKKSIALAMSEPCDPAGID
ncbi:MAG TPA: hypothetical protein PK402_00305 [Tepidisphaeraceae bacterium]|nr:hypothetical protein [Tepidisphaeraceae bacterium]